MLKGVFSSGEEENERNQRFFRPEVHYDKLSSTWSRTPGTIVAGLANTTWPGRLQWLEVLGRRVLLDGAHNLQAAEALARRSLNAGSVSCLNHLKSS